MSGLAIGTRSKLLLAALGVLVLVGCAPVGYYDPCPYGCGGGAVVLNYDSYPGRPYYGHPHYYYGDRHWNRGRPYWR